MPQNFDVEIAEMEFDPHDLEISVGDTVTWINKDDMDHTVTQDPGSPLPFTEIIVPETSSSDPQLFDTAGVLNYHCEYHHGMTGSVKVV